ncbi:hypothetical protein J3R82DRAFT_11881 [Butyriboletus roseoflavus]|nr:hypothetical protein J3R82DRAFT_11881 [Butyriboletus roseoflavus]
MITIYGDQESERQSHSQLHPHTQLVNKEPDRQAQRPWFKRPSITWILCMKTLSSLSSSIASGPRVEVLTEIICQGHYHDSNSFGTCAGDPQVQAEVARFNAIFSIIAGLLSFCTTGWWGGFTDRYGRTRVLGMVVLGPLVGDFLLMLGFFFPNKFPGGYWFLILTPFVEGILGVPSSNGAAETTYMRDVSEPHTLSRNFAFLVGILHTGGTIGPIIGGFLNERTGSPITALYATAILHLAYAFIAWFVVARVRQQSFDDSCA